MDRLRIILAVIAGKVAICLSRMLGNQGTDIPGKISRKIYPGILRFLGDNITDEIIIITGTNGKTTTTNMVAEIVKEKGYTVVHNKAGANMITGITTAFIQNTNLIGTRKLDYALLETDEANIPLLLDEVHPNVVLITNFFRDQLDRYGEIDYTMNLIKNAVRNTDTELVLNGDDPLVAHFQNETGLHCWYFGFDDTVYDIRESMESREGRYCVFCGNELNYERYHYAQLGRFHCPACNNRNPERNFTAHKLQMNPTIEFMVNNIKIVSPYQGFYNAYNLLAAVSLSKLVGIEDEVIQRALLAYQPRAGRMENFIINYRKAVLILVKNPAGLNQALATLAYDKTSKNLFFALNDNAADGRDISWIWDADVELINDENAGIKKVICSGLRSGDFAVRVKYAGFNSDNIIIKTDLQEGINSTINQPGEVDYILCTYTALFATRKILLKMQQEKFEPPQEKLTVEA